VERGEEALDDAMRAGEDLPKGAWRVQIDSSIGYLHLQLGRRRKRTDALAPPVQVARAPAPPRCSP